jgi:type I restriction enzyme R subunit
VPQLFHPNAFILLSNGSDTKVGTLTSAWEHFFDWKRVSDEDEVGKVSLERALRGLLEPARLLDYIENFTVFEEGKGGLIKKTAKNHQFLGVNKSIARLVEVTQTQKPSASAWGSSGTRRARARACRWCSSRRRCCAGCWAVAPS